MKSHFSLVNQISINQSFVYEIQNPGFLSKWKEIHKRKRKKRSFFYLSLLKKQKRIFNQKKKSKISNYSIQNELNNLHLQAHNLLFKQTKTLPEVQFFNESGMKSWKSARHSGYNLHGESVYKNAKSSKLKI